MIFKFTFYFLEASELEIFQRDFHCSFAMLHSLGISLVEGVNQLSSILR